MEVNKMNYQNVNEKGKVLLIAPLFFGYYKEIITELEKMNYVVDYICDAPSNTNLSKALGRINKDFIKKATKKYFEEDVIPRIETVKYNVIFVIGGMTFSFTPEMVEKIKKMNRDAYCVLYQWDSEKNLPYSTKIHKYFDSVFSFDLNDCECKEIYNFLPLFYTRMYEEIAEKKIKEYEYDCSYIGTAHPQKYRDINLISKVLYKQMPRQFIYHYMPSRLKYIYHKLLSVEFRNAKYSEFKKEKVPTELMGEIIMKSECVLDAPQEGQTGLTIRTIECIGAKKKLITTNTDIKKYDFYNPTNILIFDGGTLEEDNPFFKNAYQELDERIYQKYSLREWLKRMLK